MTTDSPGTLAALLDEEITEASGLLEVLRREHAALNSGDLAGIEQAVRDKQQALAGFETRAQRSRSLYAGRPAPAHGSDAFQRRCQALQEIATACRRQNEINGGMVAAGLRHIQHAMAVLRGTPQDTALYGKSGDTLSDPRTPHCHVKA